MKKRQTRKRGQDGLSGKRSRRMRGGVWGFEWLTGKSSTASVDPATPPNTGVSGAMNYAANTIKEGVVSVAETGKTAVESVTGPNPLTNTNEADKALGTTPPTGGKTITGGKRHRKTRRRR